MANNVATYVLKLVETVSKPLMVAAAAATVATANITATTNAVNQLSNAQANVSNFSRAADSFGQKAIRFNAISQAVTGTNEALTQITTPGIKYESAMADLSAITGITGQKLDELGLKARETAKIFGGDAAGQVESYKLILSKLGPEIAQSPAALDNMGRAVQLLSKTMGGDAVAATDALTTAVNQYSVDLSNPIQASQSMARMMDIMTAGAKAGAAEVPDIAASLKVAGLSAKNAGLSFEETNAAIQVLAKGSIMGAEGGTALRNVLALMGRENWMPPHTAAEVKRYGVDLKKLADTSIPFAERMKEMAKIQGDSALIAKVFGLENKNAAMQLMQNIPLLEKFTKEVGATGTTLEMANAVANTHEARMSRIGAVFKDIGISVFEAAKSYLPYIQVSVMSLDLIAKMSPAWDLAKTGLVKLYDWLKIASVATWAFAKSLFFSGIEAAKAGLMWAYSSTVSLGQFVINLFTKGIPSLWAFSQAFVVSGLASLKAGTMWVMSTAKNLPALAASIFSTGIPSLWAFSQSFIMSGIASLKAGAIWLYTGITALPALITGLFTATAAQTSLNVAMYANPVGAFVAGLLAIGAAIGLIIYNWDTIVDYMKIIGTWLWEHHPFKWMLDLIDKVFPGFKEHLKSIFDTLIKWFSDMWNKIVGVWNKVADLFGGKMSLPSVDFGKNTITFADTTNGMDLVKIPKADNAKTRRETEASERRPNNVITMTINKIEVNATVMKDKVSEGIEDLKAQIAAAIVESANDAYAVVQARVG